MTGDAGLDSLFDDAALFPPANVPLAQAVAAHRAHQAAWYAGLVGPFVCPAARLDELADVLGDEPLAVALTLPAGPVGLESALARCARLDAVRLAAVEVMLPDGTEPRDAVAMLDSLLPQGVTGYLEVPRGARTHAVLDALAASGHRAKFRTGGLDPGAHPGERELADAVLGAVQRAVAFKCTAGLHHAVRHTDGQLEQHGFLNVLLAADAAAQGAGLAKVASLLAVRSGEEVGRGVAQLTAEGRLFEARRHFVAMGTCSITDPVGDLVALGLLTRAETTAG